MQPGYAQYVRSGITLFGIIAALAGPAAAQTAKDSAHVKAQKTRIDSASVALDALHRWCNATYTTPKYLRTVCPVVKQRPDLRVKAAEDSLLRPAAPPPPPVDTQPTPPPPPPPPPPADTQPPPSSGSVAELPRVFLSYTYPATTRTVTVAGGADLQAALNAAQRGDELVLPCDASWTGNYVLPAKPGSGWIVVRTACLAQLPPVGSRVSVSHGALMPDIVTPNSMPALATAAGASHWRLVGLEVTVAVAFAAQQYAIVALGDPNYTTLAQVPTDLVLDRMYVHGRTTTNLSRCVALNSARTQITDSQLTECHGKGFDSQAILGWNGPGPFKIVNNTLEGAGENVMFGGADPRIPGLVPSDIEIRRNHFVTPASWKGVWTKKNLFELKNAVRVLVEGNVFEGSWTDGQNGGAILLRSANQSGGCRWCRTTDVTIRRNLIRRVEGGFGFIGGAGTGIDTTLRRVHLTDNVVDSIGVGVPMSGAFRGFQFTEVPREILIERTLVTGNLYMGAYLGQPRTDALTVRDVVVARGQFGWTGDGATQGKPALDLYAPGTVWQNVTLIGPSTTTYPAGTTFVTAESQAPLAAQIRGVVRQATAGVVQP